MNIVCGIDVGTVATKVVLLRNGQVVFYVASNNEAEVINDAAKRAFDLAIRGADAQPSEIGHIVVTGSGARELLFASDRAPESACLARGVYRFSPLADAVLSIGAYKAIAVRCLGGRAMEFALNDKCAAGTGILLETMAALLETTVEASGELSLRSTERLEVQSTCAVFMESEVISLLHQGKRPEDILRAVFEGIASRVYALTRRICYTNGLVLVGGVARNKGVVKAMEEAAHCKVIVPENPEGMGALGAAIIAEEITREEKC